MFIPRFWGGTLSAECYLSVSSRVIWLPFRLFRLVRDPFWECSKPAHPGSFRGFRRGSWRVLDRVIDTLLTGLSCLVADMEPVRSVDHRQYRDPAMGLVLVGTGLRNSRTHGYRATIPGLDWVPARATSHDQSGIPTALDNQITRSEATRIQGHRDRFSQSGPTQVRAFSTDLPVRHTHLQQVAFGLLVYRSGGGGC